MSIELQEPFRLCQQPENVVGISSSSRNNNVLITIPSAVHEYNTVDQKCVSSWSVNSTTVLTHSAVQHPVNKRFYVIKNSKLLCTWSNLEDKIENIAEQFKHQILCLHVHESIEHAVLMSSDGKLIIADPSTKTRMQSKPLSIPNISALLYSNIESTKNNSVSFTALLECAKNTYYFVTFNIPLNSKHINIQGVKQVISKNNIVCATYNSKSHVLAYLDCQGKLVTLDVSLQGDSEIRQQVLDDDNNNNNNNYNGGSKQKEFHLDLPKLSVTKNARSNGFNLIAFDSSYFLFTYVTKDKQQILSVWETEYGSMLEQTIIREKITKENLNNCHITQSPSAAGIVFSIWGRYVDVCPVRAKTLTLASIMGSMNNTDTLLVEGTNSYSKAPCIGIVDYNSMGDVIELHEMQSSVDKYNKIEENLLQNILSSKTEKSFTANFNKYIEDNNSTNSIVNDRKRSGNRNNKSSVSSKKKDRVQFSTGYLSLYFITSVIAKCIQHQDDGTRKLFGEKVLSHVIKSGYCSSTSCPDLFIALIQTNSLGLLEDYFINVCDIPEYEIVTLIKYALDEDNKAVLEKNAQQNWDKKRLNNLKDNTRTPSDALLALALSVPRNDVFMLSALKDLSTKEVMCVLSVIYRWVYQHANLREKTIKSNACSARIPSYAQVLDWLSLVLDAHMTKLVLNTDAYAMIVNITTIVRQQTDLCEKMQDIKGYMVQFENRAEKDSQLEHIPAYSIERVEL